MNSQRDRLLGRGRRSDVPNRPELVARYGYDVKYASHALRLAYQGREIVRDGRLTLPMPTGEREQVLAIKRGEVPVLAVLVLAAGCGGAAGGSAVGSGGGGASAAAPRDLSGVAPCELLTTAQLDEVGLAGATARPVGSAPVRSCQWTARGSFVPTIVSILTGADMSVISAGQRGTGPSDRVEIAGYPALRNDGGSMCSILVEVGDVSVLNVVGKADPAGGCRTAQRMAELAVSHLPVS